MWSWSDAWVRRDAFMWLGARVSWPLKDISSVELTIPRHQSKTLQLRLTNGEVMTYGLRHKRAAQSMKSRRHLFEQGCCCLLQNYFAPSKVGDIWSHLLWLFLWWTDGACFRKSLFLWITATVPQILRKCSCGCACSVILVPNMNSIHHKMTFYSIKMYF